MKKTIAFLLLLQTASLISCTTDAEDEWDAAKVCPESKRGTFVDDRDGQVYKYTTIGDQVWMAQNLNYDVEDDACYYVEDDCHEMGRVYAKKAAICPTGWHVPSRDEWRIVLDKMGNDRNLAAQRLKSKSGWQPLNPGDVSNGTDDCGFNAAFAINGRNTLGLDTDFLTSTMGLEETGTTNGICRIEFQSYDPMVLEACLDASANGYVRCVKD